MLTVNVNLPDAQYPIYIGHGLLNNKELIRNFLEDQQVFLVSNETVYPLYEFPLQQLVAGLQWQKFLLPDGEQYKDLKTLSKLLDAMVKNEQRRQTTVIAFGGGVVGDLAGFAAAIYQRGVNFIQIPTTLLAQVDSSVGGKTGINHAAGKNMFGAFYQPKCVIIDTKTLETLPEREYRAGLGEVVKYGLIYDQAFFAWLEQNVQAVLQQDLQAVNFLIQRSCEIKATIVAKDEREANLRALLNFGHTFAHGIELGLGYGDWRHGEAVALGMVLAADLSVALGQLSAAEGERIKRLLQELQLPTVLPRQLTADVLLPLMAMDKKHTREGNRFITLAGIGQGKITNKVPLQVVQEIISTNGLTA